MTVMKLSEAANSFSRLSGDYGLLSLQDLLDRVPSKVEHSPADSSAEVRYGTYGTCASNCRDPERSERGLVMNQRETDTSEQVLKFAPKEKAPNRVAQLDDAGQAIVAQIRTAADLAKEDCDRAMSSCTQAFHGTQSGRRPNSANGEGG